ncbi:MAG: hypothetical protein ACE364_07955 [Chlorobiota bacterium]
MIKIIKIVSLALFSLLFLSCEDEGPIEPHSPYPEFKFPLNTGYQWVYEDEFYDSEGNFIRKAGNTKTVTVGESVKLFGKQGYEVNSVIINEDGSKEVKTKYAYTDKNGYYEYDPTFFDVVEKVSDTVERRWIEKFNPRRFTGSAYYIRNEALVGDTNRIHEANYYITYGGIENFTSYEDQNIDVTSIKISVDFQYDDNATLAEESKKRSETIYRIHESYGIVSESRGELYVNGIWRWVLKSKNF